MAQAKDGIEKLRSLNILACSMISLFLLVIYYFDTVFGNIVRSFNDDYKDYSSAILQVAFISLVFMLFFIFVFLKNLKNIQKKSIRAVSIIGILITGLYLFFDVNMILNSTKFWLMVPWWVIYALIMFILNFILLRQTVILNR